MRRRLITIALINSLCLCTIYLLGACAVPSGKGPYGFRFEELEVISVNDQALMEVSATPTEFTLEIDLDQPAWQRANSFFSLYLTPDASGGFIKEENRLVSTPGNGSAYSYEISRSYHQDGVRYTVNCRAVAASASESLAERNARNVARFIRDGTLELSLLAR